MKNKIIKMEDFCHSKGKLHPTEMTSDLYMIQLHLKNLEVTYGREMLEFAIKNLGLSKKQKAQRVG